MAIAKHRQMVLVKTPQPVIRAAAYVRMSTEHQKYSTASQLRVINEYAEKNGLTVVEQYSDEGISGLHIKGRAGLQRLLNDVVRGRAHFQYILVYDISRWGRFQDIDQSAHYEYLCRMSGVDVVYCAEIFQGDDSPMAAVYKSVRRLEAANYSRDLSGRVFNAQRYLASRGLAMGGNPKYGLRRVLVDEGGKPVRKHIPRRTRLNGFHSVFAPGPKHEVRVVRLIFRRFVKFGERPSQIKKYLDEKGFRTRAGARWTTALVRSILSDEKYIGTMVYGRNSYKMHGKLAHNPQAEWIRKTNAFPAIVDPVIFQEAQKRESKQRSRFSDEELLAMLQSFLSKHGRISEKVMMERGGTPWHTLYRRRFGSLANAYNLIGYDWTSKHRSWRERIRRRLLRTRALLELREIMEETGNVIRVSETRSRFWVGDVSFHFRVNRQCGPKYRGRIWMACLRTLPPVDFYLFGRLGSDEETIMDYYLVPRAAVPIMPWGFKIRNGPQVDAYRVSSLRGVAQRILDALARARPVRGVMTSHVAH